MANFSRLHDLYSFPDFVPAATIRGVFGDPYAVVVVLKRRRKKRAVAGAAPVIAPSTIHTLRWIRDLDCGGRRVYLACVDDSRGATCGNVDVRIRPGGAGLTAHS